MKKSLKKEAIINSSWEFISKIIEKIGALVFVIILARFLLPEGFGVYSLTMSIALIFIGFINYAVDGTLIRYVSDALSKKNKKLASGYFKYIFKIKFIFSLSAAILLLILAYPLSVFIFKKPFLFLPLFIVGFYIFVLSIESFYVALFYAFKKVKGRTIRETIKQIIRILTTLTIFFIVAKSYYVVGVIFGLILTNIIVLIFVIFYVKKFAFFLFCEEKKEINKKRVMKFLYYLLAGGVSSFIFIYVDILMLGVFLPDVKYIGFYNASVALSFGIAGLLSFAPVFLPIFTQIKKTRLESAFNSVMKYSLMITIPATFGIIVLSRYIIFVFYGREYLEASIILSILAFLIIESVSVGFIVSLFSAREKPKFVTKIFVFVLVLNIILNFILIKSFLNISQLWATVGAAMATIASRYVSLIFLITVMKKKLKIGLKSINWIKPLIASLIMFFSLFLLNKFIIKDMTLFLGVIEIILGAALYLVFMLIIGGISKKDIEIFKLFT